MLLDQMLAAGLVVIPAAAGRIRVTGPEPTVQQWADRLAANKAELNIQLECGNLPDLLERFEERAAILEFDGQMSRERAEQLAWQLVLGDRVRPP